jgi:hypothetical protein
MLLSLMKYFLVYKIMTCNTLDVLQLSLLYRIHFFLNAATQLSGDVSVNDGQQKQKNTSFTDLGPLKDTERQDLNCAVKEYLLLAGYRLTAMTFYEEVGIAVLPFFPANLGARLVIFEKVAGYILSSTCNSFSSDRFCPLPVSVNNWKI